MGICIEMAKKLGKSQIFKDIYLVYSRDFLGFTRGYLGNSTQFEKFDIISVGGPPLKKKSSPQNGKNIFHFPLKKNFKNFFYRKRYLAYSRDLLGFSRGYLGNSIKFEKNYIISVGGAPLKKKNHPPKMEK